jgi:signal transduction histidine kinase
MDHEFRTAIGIIVGFSDILATAAERGAAEAGQLSYLGDIRGAAHHLLMMVDDARRYLLLNSPTDLKRVRVPLSHVVEGAARYVEPILHNLGAKLHVAASEPIEVHADLPMLQQALANLIAELTRRAPRGGDVEVEICPGEEQVVVEVRCSTLVLHETTLSAVGSINYGKAILNRGLEGSGRIRTDHPLSRWRHQYPKRS